ATPSSVAVPPAVRGTEARHAKDTAQTHIVFATDSVPYADRRKYALLVLANVFGGGMSSRLFQRIREELGLAYAIYAFTSLYRQVGVTGVYVGTQPKTDPGRGGDPRGVRQARPHGTHRRGARRGETADAGAADAVPGESVRPDVSFGRLSDPRRA